MLNENFKSEKVETKSYPLLKNDVYQAQLLDIKAVENKKYKSNEVETVFTFEFAVLNGKDVDGNEARTRLLAKNFVPTYLYISAKNGKNTLYKIVEALLGREITQEEEAGGLTGAFLNALIGEQVRLLLEKGQSKKDANKFYSNITNFLPIETNCEPLTIDEMAKINEAKSKQKNTPKEDNQDEIRMEDIPF